MSAKRRLVGIGGAVALLAGAVVPAPVSAQFSRVSLNVGLGLFDGVGLGFAYDRWSWGGSYTGVSVTTGVAASPAGAYGVYSSGGYDLPAYCSTVSYGGWASGTAWWGWDAGWGGYHEPYWRSAWYYDCILAGPPSAYHDFHAARFFSRRRYQRWWNRYPAVYVYTRDPYWNPWGPYWSYQPAWAVYGGSWGRSGTVYVERPRTRPGVGVPSPLYRPGVDYKESPGGSGRTAVPRRTVAADGSAGTAIRTPTGSAAPAPRDARVRPSAPAGATPDRTGTPAARGRPTARTGGSPAAAPAAGREAIRTRPSQARPTTGGAPSPRSAPAARPAPRSAPTGGARATPTPRTGPATTGAPRSAPTGRAAPTTGRSGPTARTAPSANRTPTGRAAPAGRTAPAARSAPATRTPPAARSAPATRTGPAARTAPGGSRSAPAARKAPSPRATPAPRAAPSRGSAPSARPAPTTRSAPARAPARPPVRKPGGGPGGGGTS